MARNRDYSCNAYEERELRWEGNSWVLQRFCWWGCGSCGQRVSNDHMGPCLVCGGRIRRIMPTEMNDEADLGIDRPSTPRLSPRACARTPAAINYRMQTLPLREGRNLASRAKSAKHFGEG